MKLLIVCSALISLACAATTTWPTSGYSSLSPTYSSLPTTFSGLPTSYSSLPASYSSLPATLSGSYPYSDASFLSSYPQQWASSPYTSSGWGNSWGSPLSSWASSVYPQSTWGSSIYPQSSWQSSSPYLGSDYLNSFDSGFGLNGLSGALNTIESLPSALPSSLPLGFASAYPSALPSALPLSYSSALPSAYPSAFPEAFLPLTLPSQPSPGIKRVIYSKTQLSSETIPASPSPVAPTPSPIYPQKPQSQKGQGQQQGQGQNQGQQDINDEIGSVFGSDAQNALPASPCELQSAFPSLFSEAQPSPLGPGVKKVIYSKTVLSSETPENPWSAGPTPCPVSPTGQQGQNEQRPQGQGQWPQEQEPHGQEAQGQRPRDQEPKGQGRRPQGQRPQGSYDNAGHDTPAPGSAYLPANPTEQRDQQAPEQDQGQQDNNDDTDKDIPELDKQFPEDDDNNGGDNPNDDPERPNVRIAKELPQATRKNIRPQPPSQQLNQLKEDILNLLKKYEEQQAPPQKPQGRVGSAKPKEPSRENSSPPKRPVLDEGLKTINGRAANAYQNRSN